MKPALNLSARIAILGLTALLSLAAAPTQGADATLARERKPVSLTGSEWWALRPAQIGLAVQAPPRAAAPASPTPAPRPAVRMVYPALVQAR
jgi:hypothetical protein